MVDPTCACDTKDIEINDELRYNYGVEDLPWRQQVILYVSVQTKFILTVP